MNVVVGLVAIVGMFVASVAEAGLVDDINGLRLKGCDGRRASVPLQPSRDLDAVAREWSKGGTLRDALQRTGYRAFNSASMRIEGAPDNAMFLRALADHYCETLTDPSFTTIGISQRSKQVHVVVAAPFIAPTIQSADALAANALALVNEARARPRKCGSANFVAVPALTMSAMLSRAALIHAQDMAAQNFFEHEGSDGSTPAVRVTRTGYEWRSVGENIAAGPTTAQSVVDGWLRSPGHCANLMSEKFTEMGIAFATGDDSDAGIYWSQVFASPRQQ